MKQISLKRGGAAALSAAMLLSLFSFSPAYAAEDAEQNTLFTPSLPSISAPSIDETEPVRIVIELEDAPLLADHPAMQTFSSASDYLSSSRAQRRDNALASARASTKKALARTGIDAAVEHEYSAVFNGLSVVAPYGDLDEIQQLKGVKNAFVAQRYELIEPVAYEPLLNDSVPSIGGDLVQDAHYTGKGTAVAILDTGLDTSHEAFSATVNNAKYTKEDIAQLQKKNRLTIGTLDINAVYQNEKIPYAFDYADSDTNVSGGESHGTHVAGIIGANAGGKVTGVAPDAQLFIMKVFGDADGGAYDNDILAALDDAVKLGCDVINMSLGSPSGFSDAGTSVMRQVYQRVSDAGVNLMVAAGNAYSAAYHGASGNDLSLASNFDNSTVASPSTYDAALSVASSNNVKATAAYMQVGDRQIRYNDSADSANQQLISLDGSFTYVDCGVGSTADFAGKNLSGKVALIERGGTEDGEVLTFSAKEANAVSAGALAAVIYDNVEGDLISMATAHKIPCVFITRADGLFMLEQSTKLVGISPDNLGEFTDSYSGKMSDFSSWGVTPDLKLKPEITAPGGNIYSTLPGSLYGSMSGTSMASPHMAGAAALMDQYITEQLDGVNMTPAERRDLANALMMSTAVCVKDENGNPASPRKQGAGLVQLNKATTAKACLFAEDGGRPLLNLGESASGSYSMAFKAHNLSMEPITYTVSATVLTEDTVKENGKTYMAEKSRVLSESEATVTTPGTVTVGANNEARISADLALTAAGRAALDKDFPNGIFVEGFITLTPTSGDTVPLSIPFMGFYGDWADGPLFDSTLYDGEDANIVEMWLGYFGSNDGGYILGKSQYGGGEPVIDADKIAIPGGDATHHVTAVCALLRNAENLTFSVTNSGGELVYEESKPREHKSLYGEQSFYTPMAFQGWTPFDTWGDPLPDGRYTYTVSGTVDGRTQEISFPITIDSEDPEVLSSEVSGSTWKVTVHDNHYVQSVCATLGSAPLTGWVNPDESVPGASTVVEFDLSDPAFQGITQAKIALTDYADNRVVTGYYSLAGSSVVLPTSVSLNKEQQELKVGETTSLTATVLPASASNRTVTWQSSAPHIVSVTNGQLKALAEGEATITAKTVNGLTASCRVKVLPKEEQPTAGKAMASVSAPGAVSGKGDVPFLLKLEDMSRVATVSFTFTRDDTLTGGTALGMSGFTALDGIRWNGKTGTVMLSYLADGAGGSVSRKELTDVAKLTFKTALESGRAGMTLTGVQVSGYDETGTAVYFESGIKAPRAEVTIGTSRFDVNRDGVVDQLDITFCQLYYQARRGDRDWNSASICDVDGSGLVDVEDMVLILGAFQS